MAVGKDIMWKKSRFKKIGVGKNITWKRGSKTTLSLIMKLLQGRISRGGEGKEAKFWGRKSIFKKNGRWGEYQVGKREEV